MTSNFPFASFCKQYLALCHYRVSAHNWRVGVFIHSFTHLLHFLLGIFVSSFFAAFSFAFFRFVIYFCTFVSAFFSFILFFVVVVVQIFFLSIYFSHMSVTNPFTRIATTPTTRTINVCRHSSHKTVAPNSSGGAANSAKWVCSAKSFAWRINMHVPKCVCMCEGVYERMCWNKYEFKITYNVILAHFKYINVTKYKKNKKVLYKNSKSGIKTAVKSENVTSIDNFLRLMKLADASYDTIKCRFQFRFLYTIIPFTNVLR